MCWFCCNDIGPVFDFVVYVSVLSVDSVVIGWLGVLGSALVGSMYGVGTLYWQMRWVLCLNSALYHVAMRCIGSVELGF